jgi:hypothetical protein
MPCRVASRFRVCRFGVTVTIGLCSFYLAYIYT